MEKAITLLKLLTYSQELFWVCFLLNSHERLPTYICIYYVLPNKAVAINWKQNKGMVIVQCASAHRSSLTVHGHGLLLLSCTVLFSSALLHTVVTYLVQPRRPFQEHGVVVKGIDNGQIHLHYIGSFGPDIVISVNWCITISWWSGSTQSMQKQSMWHRTMPRWLWK